MHAFYILYAWNYLHSGHPVMIDLFSILNTEKQKYFFHKSCTNIGVRLKVLPPNATHKILDKHWHTAFKNKLWCPINNEGFFFFCFCLMRYLTVMASLEICKIFYTSIKMQRTNIESQLKFKHTLLDLVSNSEICI